MTEITTTPLEQAVEQLAEQWIEQLAMGGYGVAVWSAFGAVFGGLLLLWLVSHRRLKKALATQTPLRKEGQ